MKKLAKTILVAGVSMLLLTNTLQVEASMSTKSRSHNVYSSYVRHSNGQPQQKVEKPAIKKGDVKFKFETTGDSPLKVKVTYNFPKKSKLYGEKVYYAYGLNGCPVICNKELFFMSMKSTKKGYKISFGGRRDGEIVQLGENEFKNYFHAKNNKGSFVATFKSDSDFQSFKKGLKRQDWNDINKALKK